MDYLISFIEGIITFISPCLLPMLPIYISYFAGQGEENRTKTLLNATGFVIGFSIVFILLGVFAATFGSFVHKYMVILNIIMGIIMILFGLNFMGIFQIGIFNKTKKLNLALKNTGFFSSILFGIIFSIGWTPCVGTFLGTALMLAASTAEVGKGIVMLVCFCLGLGIPFLVSAVLINQLKTTFAFIKRHYKRINQICGIFLIIMGILMMTGLMNKFLSMLSFT